MRGCQPTSDRGRPQRTRRRWIGSGSRLRLGSVFIINNVKYDDITHAQQGSIARPAVFDLPALGPMHGEEEGQRKAAWAHPFGTERC